MRYQRTQRFYVKCDKAALMCGCLTGYWTQGSLLPFRHKHVRVAVMGVHAEARVRL